MAEEKKDVDLYEELKKTLAESEEEETLAPSEQKPTTEKTVEKPNGEDGELSEEEISKLAPRAQKRIRELADKVKELAEQPKPMAEEKVIVPQVDDKEEVAPQEFKNVNEFLEAVEDEPSRKLLEKFYGVIKQETSTVLAPIEKANAEAKFAEEFAKYEKIDGLADYKNDLRKTFLRNPNQSLKSMIGEIVADIQLNKVKPIESSPSTPNRGKIDTENLSKEQLYDMLDTLRE